MFKAYSNKSIGAYLRKLIDRKFKSQREFGKEILKLQYNRAPSESEINNMNNKLTQICYGKNSIQIEDLPYYCELLEVSCEEIISCGKHFMPIKNHMTNYEIAFSKNRAVWEKYMNHPDNLFLNFDEYGKSVIDYALEFKNYEFMKYLIDEGFIWFVDDDERIHWAYTYGAGTCVKRREIHDIDSKLPYYIQSEDKLRTQTIALAIENHDYTILDKFKAREVPLLGDETMFAYLRTDYSKYRNDSLIEAIAESDEFILDYFSQEFDVENNHKKTNTFIFPYIKDIIELMLKDKNKNPELLIRGAIKHNKKAYEQLNNIIDEACQESWKNQPFEITDELSKSIRESVLRDIHIDENSSMLSFYYIKIRPLHEHLGMVTNIVHIDGKSNKPLINELLTELNEWYDKIKDLQKEGK